MPRPRSTLFPYTTLFRSLGDLARLIVQLIRGQIDAGQQDFEGSAASRFTVNFDRSEERFSRNAETEIYTLSLHDALPISRRSRAVDRSTDPRADRRRATGL